MNIYRCRIQSAAADARAVAHELYARQAAARAAAVAAVDAADCAYSDWEDANNLASAIEVYLRRTASTPIGEVPNV